MDTQIEYEAVARDFLAQHMVLTPISSKRMHKLSGLEGRDLEDFCYFSCHLKRRGEEWDMGYLQVHKNSKQVIAKVVPTLERSEIKEALNSELLFICGLIHFARMEFRGNMTGATKHLLFQARDYLLEASMALQEKEIFVDEVNSILLNLSGGIPFNTPEYSLMEDRIWSVATTLRDQYQLH